MFKHKTLAVLAMSLVLFSGARSEDLGIPDTLRVSVDTLRIGQSIPYTVHFFNDDPIVIFSLAHEFIPIDGGFAIYDSVVFVGRMSDPSVMNLRGVYEGNIDGSPTDTIGVHGQRFSGNSLPAGEGAIVDIYLTGVSLGTMAIAAGGYPPIERNVVQREGASSSHYPFFVADTAIVLESVPLPSLHLPDTPQRYTDGANSVLFNLSGSSPNSFPVTLSLASFESYDDPARVPITQPWLSSGNPATFGWSPDVADIGIWNARFSVCDSSGSCSFGSVEIQIVEDNSYLISFDQISTEFFHATGLFTANCDDDMNPEIIGLSDGAIDGHTIRTIKLIGTDSIATIFNLPDRNLKRAGQTGFIDSDDKIDIVTAQFNSYEYVSSYRGNGDGSFTEMFESSLILPGTGRGAVLGEFTSDQYVDYVVVTLPAVVLWAGDSLGQFTEVSQIPLGSDSGVTINTGDFDSDGNQDLAVGTRAGIRIYLGDGAGNFSLEGSYSQTFGTVGLEVTNEGSDFNNDNILDLCIATPSVGGTRSELIIYLGDGAGSFSQSFIRDVQGQLLANTIGDFDLDGELDIALVNGSDSYIAILFGDGSGGFANEIRIHIPGEFPNYIVSADFDLDGDLDLAVASNQSLDLISSLHIFLNQLDPPDLTTTDLVVNGIDNTELQLTSASGKVLNKVKRTSSSGGYYQRNINNNSIIDEMLYTNVVEQGAYTISVSPKPNLPAGELFSLEYSLSGQLHRLANDIPMSPSGYDFVVFPSGSSEVLPVPGAFSYSNPPSFLWNGSGQFQFQLSSDIDFDSIIADLIVDGSSYTLPTELPVTDTSMFFWRIKPVDQAEYDAFYPVNVMAGGSGLCGDIDESGVTDIGDLTFLVSYLFRGGPAPPDPAQADLDNSGAIDIADLTYFVSFMFAGGPPPICL